MPFAVVTGATQGIGRAIAEKLLDEGFSIAVCARNKERLDSVERQWNERFPEASVITYDGDLGIRENALAFAAKITEAFPEVDILVNNAGMFMPGNIGDEPEGRLEQLMAVNLYSAYYLTRGLLPGMKAATAGHIFNMCSVASLKAYPNGGSYSISKYALLGFSENLRDELKPFSIKVTAICPGATYTSSWEGSGVLPERIMDGSDVANMLWSAYKLSAQANVETIVMRPVKGDL